MNIKRGGLIFSGNVITSISCPAAMRLYGGATRQRHAARTRSAFSAAAVGDICLDLSVHSCISRRTCGHVAHRHPFACAILARSSLPLISQDHDQLNSSGLGSLAAASVRFKKTKIESVILARPSCGCATARTVTNAGSGCATDGPVSSVTTGPQPLSRATCCVAWPAAGL